LARLFFVRHGRTSWNEQRRIQGHTDIGLSPRGRVELGAIQPHPSWVSLNWYSSPLKRALQTASAIGAPNPVVVPALIETNWGSFEGMSLTEIESEIYRRGILPATGLDFQPPDGESPRMVRQRLADWLAETFDANDTGPIGDIGCVSHKGVIRAALSLATGWDMERPFDSEIDWRRPMAFERRPHDALSLSAINLSWRQSLH